MKRLILFMFLAGALQTDMNAQKSDGFFGYDSKYEIADGYKFYEKDNSSIKTIAKEKPDFVVLSLTLKRSDGIAVIKKTKEIPMNTHERHRLGFFSIQIKIHNNGTSINNGCSENAFFQSPCKRNKYARVIPHVGHLYPDNTYIGHPLMTTCTIAVYKSAMKLFWKKEIKNNFIALCLQYLLYVWKNLIIVVFLSFGNYCK